MTSCIIIEDQPPAQRILKKFIEDLGSLELKGTFSEATDAMELLQSGTIDLIFLDIHLPKISGIEFLKILPNRPNVILTTAFADYALQSYELNVVDYLLKPFSFQRFVQAVAKVQGGNKSGAANTDVKQYKHEVFIKSGYDHLKVVVSDIQFIKSDADYTEIIVGEKKHISSEPLRFWINYLDPQQFVRVHKSYIVNISRINKISGNQVFLLSGETLPIGRAYKDDFSRRFLK